MRRLVVMLGLCCLGFALLVGSGISQEKKDKVKGMLPPMWKSLNLGKDQITKIYTIQTDYRGKVQALEKQIQQLKIEERTEMVKVLTDDQKKLLQKLTVGEDSKKSEK